MNYSQILAIIKQKTGIMILAGLFLAAVSFWGIMLFSPKYQSNFDLLVLQNSEEFVDSYTLAKSTEHVSKLLSESVYSETFLTKVIENYPDIVKALPMDKENRMKSWGKMVRTSLNPELGIIHFKVLANSKDQAENISRSVASVLANSNNLFISLNQKVEVRVLNTPVVKSNPGAAMLVFVALASLAIGIIFVFVVSFYVLFLGQGKSGNKTQLEDSSRERKMTKDDEGNIIDAGTGEIIAYRQE